MSERVVVTPCAGDAHSERWTTKDGRFVCRYCGVDKGPVRAAETEPIKTCLDRHACSVCEKQYQECRCMFALFAIET